jgi:hypothetical protein
MASLFIVACRSDEPSTSAEQVSASADSGVPLKLPFPEDIIAPPWLETSRQAQLETVGQFDVFYDFAFSDQLEESAISFRHRITPDSGRDYRPNHYDHGNGVAIADVDGDGRYDIYFVTQIGSNQLWRNLGGGKFEDITERAGVAVADPVGVSASFADIDNDGDPDLYVTVLRQGNMLFENDGTGAFVDISEQAGLGYKGHPSGAVFFDYNGDGLLDLFLTTVGHYTTDELKKAGRVVSSESKGDGYMYYSGFDDGFSGHLKPERIEVSILFENAGDNRFVDVSESVGLTDAGWSGAASPIDINEDGWPDLYVLNMQGHDHYYENVEGKKFVDKSREVFPKTPWGSMGVKVFDYDNDGAMDLYVTDMHSDMSENAEVERDKLKSRMRWAEDFLRSGGNSIYGNAFYKNKGDGQFEEVSDQIGAENYWPWGFSVGDLNADGYEDVFIASSMNYPFRYGINSVLLNNRGEKFLDSEFILGVEPRRDGRTAQPWFELECSWKDRNHRHCRDRKGDVVVWGALGSRSSAIFDLDDDGDLDIVTNDFNSEPMVLISDLSEKKPSLSFLKVELIGTASNRSGLGATVKVRAGSRTYSKVHDGQSGYLTQSLYPLYFGLGEAETVDEIAVRWPSGREQIVTGPIGVNSLVEVTEP